MVLRLLYSLWLVSAALGSIASADQPPGKVLDLSCWKLTLPAKSDRPDRPLEIAQPRLATYRDEYFFASEEGTAADGRGIVFRAPCGGVTTRGSKYPRCELREMSGDGRSLAAWSTDDDATHTLVLRVAITRAPPVKPHVVCAQIHDAEDDLMMVRLEGKKLFVERNSLKEVPLDANYELGTPLDLKIEAGQGEVNVYYNGARKLNWQVSRRGCYFKAGCYTQSNPDKGDAADSLGEVVIYQLDVMHQPR